MRPPVWNGRRLSGPGRVPDMGGDPLGSPAWVGQALSNWTQFVFAAPVVLWAGWPFFVRGWQSIVTRNLNMFTLIAIGTGTAWLYSVIATAAPGLFPRALRAADGSLPVSF